MKRVLHYFAVALLIIACAATTEAKTKKSTKVKTTTAVQGKRTTGKKKATAATFRGGYYCGTIVLTDKATGQTAEAEMEIEFNKDGTQATVDIFQDGNEMVSQYLPCYETEYETVYFPPQMGQRPKFEGLVLMKLNGWKEVKIKATLNYSTMLKIEGTAELQ